MGKTGVERGYLTWPGPNFPRLVWPPDANRAPIPGEVKKYPTICSGGHYKISILRKI
ncbi:hypothetical protein WN48_08230 [Eufriesea mexicana]|uniref:Uncharacterized protein n=1 Tax=Eufriesea mexicana TaxID=516756 RepID=A0A310SJF7_9HYME|nr:hypothetical protein WN48_08230 [Eufriesea mexicana]